MCEPAHALQPRHRRGFGYPPTRARGLTWRKKRTACARRLLSLEVLGHRAHVCISDGLDRLAHRGIAGVVSDDVYPAKLLLGRGIGVEENLWLNDIKLEHGQTRSAEYRGDREVREDFGMARGRDGGAREYYGFACPLNSYTSWKCDFEALSAMLLIDGLCDIA